MRYITDDMHREFFQENGFIEFESILPEKQIQDLRTLTEETLCTSLKAKKEDLEQLGAEVLFMAGRDLWREHPELQKAVSNRGLAATAAELCGTKPLRLAYTQAFSSFHADESVDKSNESLKAHFQNTFSLNESSSFQGLCCALMICLEHEAIVEEGEEGEEGEKEEEEAVPEGVLDAFPRHTGNGIFFKATAPIDFHRLFDDGKNSYLMIVFSEVKACYVKCELDLHGNALKDLDYNFGDRLNDEAHPIVAR